VEFDNHWVSDLPKKGIIAAIKVTKQIYTCGRDSKSGGKLRCYIKLTLAASSMLPS
jgi:hypothetical protein